MLAVVHRPLLAVIAAAAMGRIDEFEVVQIASLLWSFSTLALVDAEGGLAPAQLRVLAGAPAVLDGEWQGHSLCLLANSLKPVSDALDPGLWTKVEGRWLAQLEELATALEQVSFPPEPGPYLEALRASGCYHVGPRYTQGLLQRLGIQEAPAAFTTAGRHATAGRQEGIIAVADFSISFGDRGAALEGSRLLVSESRGGGGVAAGSAAASAASEARPLVAAPLAHDRSGHAEFQLLCGILDDVEAAAKDNAATWRSEAAGTLHLYVTHHPCLSCIGALCQFRAALPGVAVSVSFDWRPASPRGGR